MLQQAVHQLGARVLLLLRRRGGVEREQQLRLDVNQRRSHQYEVSGDVHVQPFHAVEVVEILLRHARNGNVEDVDFLLANQVQQQVQWTFINIQL